MTSYTNPAKVSSSSHGTLPLPSSSSGAPLQPASSSLNSLGRSATQIAPEDVRETIAVVVSGAFKSNPQTIKPFEGLGLPEIEERVKNILSANLAEQRSLEVYISPLERVKSTDENRNLRRTIGLSVFHQLKAYPETIESLRESTPVELKNWACQTLLKGVIVASSPETSTASPETSNPSLLSIDKKGFSEEEITTTQNFVTLETDIEAFRVKQREFRTLNTGASNVLGVPTEEEARAIHIANFQSNFETAKRELLGLSERYSAILPQIKALIEKVQSMENPEILNLFNKHLTELEEIIVLAKKEVNRQYDAMTRKTYVFISETRFNLSQLPVVGRLVGGYTDPEVNATFTLSALPAEPIASSSSAPEVGESEK